MTAAQLLDSLRHRGVTLFVEGNRLRYRALPGVYTQELRQAVAEQRAELLTLLTGSSGVADRELRQVLQVLDTAASASRLSPGQRGVLAAMRAVVERYHRDRDVLLFGAVNWIEAHVGRWRAEHDQQLWKKRPAA